MHGRADCVATLREFTLPPTRVSGEYDKDQIERWKLGQFIRRGGLRVTDFPVTLIHHDRPDFRIMSQEGSIGVEVTELTYQNLQLVRKYVDHYDIDIYSPPPLPEDARSEVRPFMTKAEMADPNRLIEIVKNERSAAFQGTSEEKKLAALIARRIREKCDSFEKSDFQRFQCNVLVFYENASPVPPMMKALRGYIYDEVACYLGGLQRHQEIWLLSGELIQIAPEKTAP